MQTSKTLLICDLDNTLYDWYDYFVPAIFALIDEAAKILSCDPQDVIRDLRRVHQKYHDSEHPFALLETQIVLERFPGEFPVDLFKKLNPAFYAFNKSRKYNLKLFEHVFDTLHTIRGYGIKVVAHTESKLYGAVDRVHRLGLEPFLDRIYCREESPTRHPTLNEEEKWLKDFNWQKVVRLPHKDVKPNARIVRDICLAENVAIKNVIYVGDSFARDVLMAKHAGVFAVWAEYGSKPSPSLYEKLIQISHWTPADVERERKIREQAAMVQADFICHQHFAEVLVAIANFKQQANRED